MKKMKGYIKKRGWMRAEEIIVYDCQKSIHLFISTLIDLGLTIIAQSVYYRNNQLMKDRPIFFDDEYLIRSDDCQINGIEGINYLVEKDKFYPTPISTDKNNEYMSCFEDFQMELNKNIILIKEIGEKFETYKKLIGESCQVIGIDCEYTVRPFSKSKFKGKGDGIEISTIQIAFSSKNKNKSEIFCIVYDCLALKNNLEFKDWMKSIIQDKSISKVAHSIEGDISMLKKFLKMSLVSRL